ncbi:MAG: hypothetical protein II897_04040 [Clostridia bacterium]|nr:hypothetical protein [Clostridia bacterium]
MKLLMDLRKAQTICNKIDGEYAMAQMRGNVEWTEVFENEDAIIAALRDIAIPQKRIAPVGTFKGYEYIYSFAFYAQKGWNLREAQMRQCKRLAVEIKKAAAIACCYSDK